MKRLLIKNGILLDKSSGLLYEKKDLLIEDGRIAAAGEDLCSGARGCTEAPGCGAAADAQAGPEGLEILDAKGAFVSPGFIDIHVHNNLKRLVGHEDELDPLDSIDHLGVLRGATTVIEAGSWCVDDFGGFLEQRENAESRYYTLLSAHGADGFGSYGSQDISKIHPEHYLRLAEEHPGTILGLKIACSNTMCGDRGYGLAKHAKMIASMMGLPLTVHIGNFPPDPLGIIEFMEKGDVMTHAYHGKEISLFRPDGSPKEGVVRARERGVIFDVGHGSASWSLPVYERAISKGFLPDLIGTDIRAINLDGPVYSLPVVMSKITALGMPLEDAVEKVTSAAAKAYGLAGLGTLKQDALADVEIFRVKEAKLELPDCGGVMQSISRLIVPESVIVSKGGKSSLIPVSEGLLV